VVSPQETGPPCAVGAASGADPSTEDGADLGRAEEDVHGSYHERGSLRPDGEAGGRRVPAALADRAGLQGVEVVLESPRVREREPLPRRRTHLGEPVCGGTQAQPCPREPARRARRCDLDSTHGHVRRAHPLPSARVRHQGAVQLHQIDFCLEEVTFRFNRRQSGSRGKLFYLLVPQVEIAPAPYRTVIRPAKDRTH